MNLDNLTSIDQLAEFLSGTQAVAFSVLSSPAARYEWVQKTLVRFGYLTLSRPHQGIVIRVLMKVSGYSRQQITRLIPDFPLEPYADEKTGVKQTGSEKVLDRSHSPSIHCRWRIAIASFRMSLRPSVVV